MRLCPICEQPQAMDEDGCACVDLTHEDREDIRQLEPVAPFSSHAMPTPQTTLSLPGQWPTTWGHDLRWHDELHAGDRCPRCQRYTLKRYHNTVYCAFCRQRWWSHDPKTRHR